MKIFTRILLMLALSGPLFAQQPAKGAADQPAKKDAEVQERPPETFYKLAFVLYELEDGKRVNQRDYTMLGRTNSSPSRIAISTRVPVYSEEKKMQYIDAGLTLSCSIRELTGGKVQAQCDINVGGFVRQDQIPEARGNGVASAPVLRSTAINSWAVLTPGKPAIMASIDDINSTKRMQIEVTATKLD